MLNYYNDFSDDVPTVSFISIEKIEDKIFSLFNRDSSEWKKVFNDEYFLNPKSKISELFKNLYNEKESEIRDSTGLKDFLKKNLGKEFLGKSNLWDFNYKICEEFIEEYDKYFEDIEDIERSFFFAYIYFCIINSIIISLENSYIGGFKDDYLTKELLYEKYKSLRNSLVEKAKKFNLND